MARLLSLTADHVARVHRVVEDRGPTPGAVLHTDKEYASWVSKMIATHPAPDRPTQLFAFGSLIWKPEIEFEAERTALLRGWHRSFCLRMNRFRGTSEYPGLMMALDRGGSCRGVIYELPSGNLDEKLDRLFRREFTVKPINNTPTWVTVTTEIGAVHALAFTMNRTSPAYRSRLSPEDVAATLANACGHWGSGAEYLFNTVSHLEQRGIHDRGLWRLQRLVAEHIDGLNVTGSMRP